MFGSLLRPRHHHGIRTITVLSPIVDDAVADTEDRLKRLGNGSSPFAASARTHFARLVVLPPELRRFERPQGMRRYARIIDAVAHLGRAQQEDELSRPYLLFSAGYDDDDPSADAYRADHSSYIEHLRRCLGPEADDIWKGCDGYPGRHDAASFGAFLAAGTTSAAYIFAPEASATVPRVREALRLRRRVTTVAVATQQAPDAELRARFDEVFASPDDHASQTPTTPTAAATAAPTTPHEHPDGPVDESTEWNSGVDEAVRYASLPRAAACPELDLADVQGLTVGYPTHAVAAFVLLRVTDPVAARAWLATTPISTAAQAKDLIVGAGPAGPTRPAGPTGPAEARHVAVSHHGLVALGLPEDRRWGFDPAFRTGMARREHALAPQQGVGSWQAPYRPETGEAAAVDVLVHLSAPDADLLNAALRRLDRELAASAAFTEVVREGGRQMLDTTSLPTGRPRYLEHFGFADGGSQPAITGLRPEAPDTLPTGELLLGHTDVDGDTAGATAPTDLALNGCYLVFRKLEQDVPAFRALGADDDARARLVGRRRDGVALTPSGAPDADYRFHSEDPDGLHCPIGSHVRRVNPRDARPLTVGLPDHDRKEPVEPRLSRRHRMLRRGIPYGDPYPADGERGLLFVALVGDIGRQYEFVQTQWMNEGQSFRLGSDPDVFSGVAGPGRKVTLQGHPPAFVELPRPVVTCRGGEYFLLPGVAALRRLARPVS